MSFEFDKVRQTVWLKWMILWVLELVLDRNRFLEGPARCWNQEKCLNCAGRLISVFNFSSSFWNLVWPFQWTLGRESGMEHLHMYVWMRISHIKSQWSIAMMFLDFFITTIKAFSNFVQIWIFMLKMALARNWQVVHDTWKPFKTQRYHLIHFFDFIWIIMD